MIKCQRVTGDQHVHRQRYEYQWLGRGGSFVLCDLSSTGGMQRCARPCCLTAFPADRLPKADVNWLSKQLTAVVDSLMPSSEECARQAAAFDKVSAQHRNCSSASSPTKQTPLHLFHSSLEVVFLELGGKSDTQAIV